MLHAKDNDFSPPEAGAQEAALGLVNPISGLANDYLNVFNEVLLLLEFLPTMPEMTEEALAWQPRSYCAYFEQSTLPDAKHALRAYADVDPLLRRKFESVLSRLNQIVTDAQSTIAQESTGPDYPDSIVGSCEATAEQIRIGLAYVNRLINEGAPSSAGASRSRKTKS
ncbi:hypothetical protein CCR94_05955 [Rhodoblastus sphagnicola]|uniref:Uncharacterized protein n=1 Tax=Rhodoblastus sphagnicola TaxID=333368 RepID=A0A2S6NCJ8_9HYPH|nr:hypothetical protein [Rhodoblastus sphagnicola]MBB4199375.1 hypothetical protein [Rhodoblastus sphagnicola]PPQ32350.1 hypothetical protein CCR94_05955 [Rhodoblastus sphagnicola]